MKYFAKKTFIVICGIIFALIIIEIFLRINNPSKIRLSENNYNFSCYQAKEYAWIGLKPNAVCPFTSQNNAFPDTFVKTNSMGLRNKEVELSKSSSTKRVLFIGDSFTMGVGVHEHEAYPRLSEEFLKSSNVESINAGVPGTGPGYYYLFLKNEGLLLNPDVIVVGFYLFNDIFDEDFKKTWASVDKDGLPIISNSTTVKVINGQLVPIDLPFFLHVNFLKEFKTFQLMWYYWPFRTKQKIHLVSSEICLFRKDCHSFDEEKENKKKLFLAIKKIAQENNKKLLVVIIPSEFQIYSNKRLKYKILVPLSPEDKKRPNTEFGTFFEKNNIDYLDLLPIFGKYPNETTFYEKDNHWNPLGHRIAADAISKKILDILYYEKQK